MSRLGPVGWLRLADPAIAAWAAAALPVAQDAVATSTEAWRCGGTWFVGVDALANGPDGRMGDTAFPWAALQLAPRPLHRGQISTMRPGYPQPSPDEDATAYGFRLRRDAAHLDGMMAVGPDRRRMVKEPHAWILGLPLTSCDPAAAPLSVWEGSHIVMRRALEAVFAGQPRAVWGDLDLTEPYKAARAEVFRSCRRVELPATPGQALLLHRHLIHGVAPWAEGAVAPPEGRMVAYFRPLLPSVEDWMQLP